MGPDDRKIRVVVADDSRTALRAVCSYLEFEGQFEIVATASDGLSVLHQVERFRPDLVLTDISMPQMTGLEVAMELRKSFPELRILIFTELNGLSLRAACLQCGADGFVQKSHAGGAHGGSAQGFCPESANELRGSSIDSVRSKKERERVMATKKILLVDDSCTARLVNRMIFSQKTNYVLISAVDGKEAVERAKREMPDLILMDIVMPRMTGLEACRVLKKDKETEKIPVILLTTRGEEQYVQEGYASGCSDYLTKPVNDAELLDLLKAYLGE